MTFTDYQKNARETAIYPTKNGMGPIYCALKLNGEAGEVAEKVGKILRDNDGLFTEEKQDEIALELGDVLWYVANLAYEIGYSLDKIAELNLTKLASRKKRNVISGSGDTR